MNVPKRRRLFSLVLAMLLVIAAAVHAGYSPADDNEPKIAAEGALGDSPAKAICPYHRDGGQCAMLCCLGVASAARASMAPAGALAPGTAAAVPVTVPDVVPHARSPPLA